MKLGELVENYRLNNDLSQRQFANKCGLSNGYISMIERGENPRSHKPLVPSITALKKISDAMSITLTELMASVDDFPVSLIDGIDDFPENIIPFPDVNLRPRLGTIACGVPILAEQNVEGYDQVPDFVRCDFTLRCKGDSMIGARIYDGDIVYIKQQPEVEQGQIAAVLIGNEATLKRVRYIEGGVALWPENPAYEPMIFTGRDVEKVRVLGLATHFTSTVK